MDEDNEKKPIPIWQEAPRSRSKSILSKLDNTDKSDKIGGLKPGFTSMDEWPPRKFDSEYHLELWKMGFSPGDIDKLVEIGLKYNMNPVTLGQLLRSIEPITKIAEYVLDIKLEGSYSTKPNHYERMMRNRQRRKKK